MSLENGNQRDSNTDYFLNVWQAFNIIMEFFVVLLPSFCFDTRAFPFLWCQGSQNEFMDALQKELEEAAGNVKAMHEICGSKPTVDVARQWHPLHLLRHRVGWTELVWTVECIHRQIGLGKLHWKNARIGKESVNPKDPSKMRFRPWKKKTAVWNNSLSCIFLVPTLALWLPIDSSIIQTRWCV